MHDLTGAAERRATIILALLVMTVLLLPAGANAQTTIDPMVRPTETVSPTPTPTPTPTVTPTPTPTATEDDAVSVPGLPDAEAPTPPALPGHGAGGEPSPTPGAVQAEGGSTEEVVAPPVAPAPQPREPAGDQVAAADGTPPTEAVPGDAEAGVEPPPLDSYGPQLTPSLGTATSPQTNELADFAATAPLVLAPQIAGQPGQPAQPAAAVPPVGWPTETGLLGDGQPVKSAAAATLSIVQPSWYATAAALLILLAAAVYAAVLRQRGQDVPEILAIPSAIRPGDSPMHTVRSIRPADMGPPQVRSIRP